MTRMFQCEACPALGGRSTWARLELRATGSDLLSGLAHHTQQRDTAGLSWLDSRHWDTPGCLARDTMGKCSLQNVIIYNEVLSLNGRSIGKIIDCFILCSAPLVPISGVSREERWELPLPPVSVCCLIVVPLSVWAGPEDGPASSIPSSIPGPALPVGLDTWPGHNHHQCRGHVEAGTWGWASTLYTQLIFTATGGWGCWVIGTGKGTFI